MKAALRIGVVGIGNIGQQHIKLLRSGAIERARLAAVSSRTPPEPTMDVPHFEEPEALFASGLVDAVLIATPTDSHPHLGQRALAHHLHVLMEKPVAMSLARARPLLAAKPDGCVLAVMLNQRHHPAYARLKQLLAEDAVGEITRVAWTMTTWYRPDVYYQVSSWRGTWPGEGGGALINQCIHNIDVLQWLTGLPQRVAALGGFGKYHTLDVEDEMSALLTWPNGATGTLVASTGEAPGVNQLDIVGDRGMLRWDGEAIQLWRSSESIDHHRRHTSDMFGTPDFEVSRPTLASPVDQHAAVLLDFVDAALDEHEVATPAEEALASVALANAMVWSAWRNEPVDLPLDEAGYESFLEARIAESGLRTPVEREVNIDMDQSYR